MLRKSFLLNIFSFTILLTVLTGCGTDVKPSYFLRMLKDPSDADRLIRCSEGRPIVNEDGTIVLTVNQQCLVDFTNRETIEKLPETAFQQILENPEEYLDKLVMFRASIKENGIITSLYTDRQDREFLLNKVYKLYILDEAGEKQALLKFTEYEFRCHIIEIRIMRSGVWIIIADPIFSDDDELVFPPTPVVKENK